MLGPVPQVPPLQEMQQELDETERYRQSLQAGPVNLSKTWGKVNKGESFHLRQRQSTYEDRECPWHSMARVTTGQFVVDIFYSFLFLVWQRRRLADYNSSMLLGAGYWITWFEHYDLSDEVEVFPQNPGEHSQNEVNQHEATILRYSPTFTYVAFLGFLVVYPEGFFLTIARREQTNWKRPCRKNAPNTRFRGWTLRQQRVWVMGCQGFSKGISPLNSDGNGLPVIFQLQPQQRV